MNPEQGKPLKMNLNFEQLAKLSPNFDFGVSAAAMASYKLRAGTTNGDLCEANFDTPEGREILRGAAETVTAWYQDANSESKKDS